MGVFKVREIQLTFTERMQMNLQREKGVKDGKQEEGFTVVLSKVGKENKFFRRERKSRSYMSCSYIAFPNSISMLPLLPKI